MGFLTPFDEVLHHKPTLFLLTVQQTNKAKIKLKSAGVSDGFDVFLPFV